MSDEQLIFDELKKNYATYYKDLIAYVIWIADNRYSWSRETKTLPGGKTPEDIAQEVISKTLSGVRKTYDPNKGTLPHWLRLQARSIVDALAKSAIHRNEQELSEEEFVSISQETNPEDELIEKEYQIIISKLVDRLFQITDPALKEIIEEVVFNGCEPKPRFLAKALETDEKDINNRLKRLRRLAQKGEIADE